MLELPVDPIVLILAVSTLIALLLYLREYNLRQTLQKEGDKFLSEIKEKGWENIHQSIKKSQAILTSAELEGIKLVADSRFTTSKMEQQYEQQLSEIIKHSEAVVTETQSQLLKFIQQLQQTSSQFEEESRQASEQRINQMFGNLEQRLTDFLIKTEQNTTSSIELELKSARQLIENYKTQQLKLIDENIIAMMEQTLSLVLAKKLSLKDQLDLVYESLEKAKVEKFIV